jgi:hypothetical protein
VGVALPFTAREIVYVPCVRVVGKLTTRLDIDPAMAEGVSIID